MIKFFRKIRYNLMSKGQTSKYLKYAIGEILLVVIGILIALQINNLNEDRKTKNFEYDILSDIQFGLENNFWQLEMGVSCGQEAINSVDIILNHLENDLEYHDSLDIHFSRSVAWCNAAVRNAGYESLKTYGRRLITNDSILNQLIIYDQGWLESLGQRQEDYFYNTASPVLTELFEVVAMRSEMKPFDYEKLKTSNAFISILQTSKALRKDQIFWYNTWIDSLKRLKEFIDAEMASRN